MPRVEVLCDRQKEATDDEDQNEESLPIGQPRGLAAFSDGSQLRFWRVFSHRDLHPDWWAGGMKGVRTLMTVDQRDGYWHVCFMHDWEYGGAGVPNSIEELAGAVYREALVQSEQRRAERRGLRGWLGRQVPVRWRRRASIASRFRFYEHLPPQERHEEEFGLVRMSFRHGEFSSPEWTQYDVIPRVIASARHELKHKLEMRPQWA